MEQSVLVTIPRERLLHADSQVRALLQAFLALWYEADRGLRERVVDRIVQTLHFLPERVLQCMAWDSCVLPDQFVPAYLREVEAALGGLDAPDQSAGNSVQTASSSAAAGPRLDIVTPRSSPDRPSNPVGSGPELPAAPPLPAPPGVPPPASHRQRKKTALEKHLKWQEQKRRGLSYAQIANKHRNETGVKVSADTVKKALKRLEKEKNSPRGDIG